MVREADVPHNHHVTTEPAYLTAIRAGYDTVAANYAELVAGALESNPFDRAMLALFADLVRDAPSSADRRVVEVGCGPGRITAHLAKLGLDTFGIDLSPAMIEQARLRHPDLEFRVGQMTELDLPTASMAGLVAWYSLIHIPPSEHHVAFACFTDVLVPGGHLLLAFHAGDERRRLTDAYGHSGLDFDSYRLRPELVEREAVSAGFEPVARLTREPIGPEKTAQAYLILRRTDGG
jgi:SAM-dependent methyltransferase